MNKELVEKCKELGIKLATAESCTGGRIADQIVSVSGASSVYGYGFVTYSNEAKIKELNVSPFIIDNFGAVSAECACEMAEGVRLTADADLGISSTGVAGPSEDEGKPVGLVYIAVAYNNTKNKTCYIRASELHLTGDRDAIRNAATKEAIKLALSVISEQVDDGKNND